MTDQSENASGIHSESNACMFRDECRALEAKVREGEDAVKEMVVECMREIAATTHWRAHHDNIRADRDRLAGEVERLRKEHPTREDMDDISEAGRLMASAAKKIMALSAEVARLTSELAAARENEARLQRDVDDAYGWLWCVNEEPGTPNRFPAERAAYNARKLLRDLLTKEQRGIGINKAVIQRDAARSAGGGE